MAEFAYLTGWRVQPEVLPLEWRNIDLKARTVTLEPGTTKNGEGRTIYLTAALRTLLEAQKAAGEALAQTQEKIVPYVFHRNGKPIRGFYKRWRKRARQPAVRGSSCTTSGGRLSATTSVRAFPSAWRCR